MFDTIPSAERLEFLTCECSSIVRNQGTWQSVRVKLLTKLHQRDGSIRRCHDTSIDVLRVSVYNDKDKFPFQWTSIVNVYTIPRFTWTFPYVLVCLRWQLAVFLANNATTNIDFNFCTKDKGTFLYSAISSSWVCSKFYTSPLFIPMQFRLLWEAFSHATITARTLFGQISTSVCSHLLIVTAE